MSLAILTSASITQYYTMKRLPCVCVCVCVYDFNIIYRKTLWNLLTHSMREVRVLLSSSLRGKRFQSSYSAKVRAEAKRKKWKGEGEGRRGNACRQTPRFWKTPLDISRFGSFVNWQLVKIDNEQITRFEKFTLFPKTRSTRLQNCNKKKLYYKRRSKL